MKESFLNCEAAAEDMGRVQRIDSSLFDATKGLSNAADDLTAEIVKLVGYPPEPPKLPTTGCATGSAPAAPSLLDSLENRTRSIREVADRLRTLAAHIRS